jgi:hypothetical protein
MTSLIAARVAVGLGVAVGMDVSVGTGVGVKTGVSVEIASSVGVMMLLLASVLSSTAEHPMITKENIKTKRSVVNLFTSDT